MRLTSLLASMSLFAVTTSYAINHPHTLKVDDAYILANGIIISGDYEGTVTQPAIDITTSTPVTIKDATVTGPGDLIHALNGNVTLYNVTGVSTNPNRVNQQKGSFYHGDNVLSLHIEKCNITGPANAFYINGYGGNHTSAQTIKILNNVIHNVEGRPSDGNGGYLNAGPYSSAVMYMVFTTQVSGMEFAWNEITNDYNQSYALETLLILDSGGTAASPYLIHDNYIQGPYTSDAGINITGLENDTPASASSFNVIYNNQVIGNALYGIQIGFGHDNTVYNNRVISSGYADDGTFVAQAGNIGLYNANVANQPATVFFNNNMHDNVVGFMNSSQRSDWSLPGQNNNVENNTAWQPNDTTHPTLADELNEYQLWLKKKGQLTQ